MVIKNPQQYKRNRFYWNTLQTAKKAGADTTLQRQELRKGGELEIKQLQKTMLRHKVMNIAGINSRQVENALSCQTHAMLCTNDDENGVKIA